MLEYVESLHNSYIDIKGFDTPIRVFNINRLLDGAYKLCCGTCGNGFDWNYLDLCSRL